MTSQIIRLQSNDGKLIGAKQRGPRTVVIQKDSTGFGFTLRHFIVFPPDSVKGQITTAENPTEQTWQSGTEAMDTIFVREVKEASSAFHAGLMTGDRIITINNQMLTGKSYSEVIDLIQNSGETLHLLVVPKEDDILQLYFSGSAYQPVERQYQPQEFRSLPSSFSPNDNKSLTSTKTSEPIYAKVNKANKIRNHSDPTLAQAYRVGSGPELNKSPNNKSAYHHPQIAQRVVDNNHIYSTVGSPRTKPPLLEHYVQPLSLQDSQCHFKPVNSPARSSSVGSDVFYDATDSLSRLKDDSGRLGKEDNSTGSYGTHRPYRVHDTLSRLLVDMWYPNKAVRRLQPREVNTIQEIPRRHYSDYENVSRMSDSSDPHHASSDSQHHHHHHHLHHHHHHVRRDHKPGFANLLSKTMKAFMPGESHHHRNRDNNPSSNSLENDVFDNPNRTRWQQPDQMFHSLQDNSTHSDVNGYSTVRSKSDEMLLDPLDDPQGQVNLVAQRLHQFESGSINDKAQERTNMYKHEFARVSSPSPCQIVSKRAAQFESLGSPSGSPGSENTVLSLQSYPPSKAQLKNYGFHRHFDPSSNKGGYQNGNAFLDYSCMQAASDPVCNYLSDGAASSLYKHDNVPGVIYRKKHMSDKERHISRRISYLKATAGERMLVESDLSEEDEKAKRLQQSAHIESGDHRMEKLKYFFGEKTPKIRQAIEPVITETKEEENWKTLQGWLTCKMVSSEGKRSTDRSWRNVWAVFKGTCLHLFRDKKETSETSELYDTTINLKTTFASIAHDYTKRKNVLRLRLANGTEYLFQADSQANMIEWLCSLKMVGLETEKELLWHHASVLEKAAAYEQQIGFHTPNSTNGGGRVSPPPPPAVPQKTAVRLPFRHRSPTGQSPAVKTRRASHGGFNEIGQGPRLGNVIKSRVVPGWKKTHSLQAEVLPKGASIGVKLEDCPHSEENEYIPLIVELCVHIVESTGIELVGLYRVPGNNAAVSMLIDTVNQGLTAHNLQDHRWNDINVVSSLLKAFFRKLPEPLLTSHLYSKFILASKLEEADQRMAALKKLIHQLPRHHFETLKYLVQHLKTVVDHSGVNKMESRNLAIVFGPTLVRPSDASMIALVTDMSHQCYIIETLINFADWLFDDQYPDDVSYLKEIGSRRMSHPLPVTHSEALLRSVQQMENAQFGKTADAFPREFLSSMALATSRKPASRARKEQQHIKQPRPSGYFPKASDSDSEPSCFTNAPVQATETAESVPPPSPCKEYPDEVSVSSYGTSSGGIDPKRKQPINRISIEEEEEADIELGELTPKEKLIDEVVHHTYDKVNSLTQERIKKFEKETKALLRRDMNQRHNSTSQSRVEWEQIEKEWEKAKREMEQEDLLDFVADDPSFMTYLLNRQQQGDTQTVPETDDQLDCISSSLENTLSLRRSDQGSSSNSSTKKSYSSSQMLASSNHKQGISPAPSANNKRQSEKNDCSSALRRYSYAHGTALPVYSSPSKEHYFRDNKAASPLHYKNNPTVIGRFSPIMGTAVSRIPASFINPNTGCPPVPPHQNNPLPVYHVTSSSNNHLQGPDTPTKHRLSAKEVFFMPSSTSGSAGFATGRPASSKRNSNGAYEDSSIPTSTTVQYQSARIGAVKPYHSSTAINPTSNQKKT